MSMYVHEEPHGRVTFGVTRMTYGPRELVTMVGPVPYESTMARVRFPDGVVRRVFRENLTAYYGKEPTR